MVIQLRGSCEPERGKDRVELRSDETNNVVYPRPGMVVKTGRRPGNQDGLLPRSEGLG